MRYSLVTTTKTGVTVTLSISPMSCAHSVQPTTKALSALPPVRVSSLAIATAEIQAQYANAAGKAVAALQATSYSVRATAGVGASPRDGLGTHNRGAIFLHGIKKPTNALTDRMVCM